MRQSVADRETFSHPIYRVLSVQVVGSYTLNIEFSDGSERTINFQPILVGEMYGPLRDPALFRQVQVDPEVHTLVWPNGADFDPATLHDWSQQAAAREDRVREWQHTPMDTEPVRRK